MKKKALELAISTLILIVLGILVMIGIIYFVTNGFKDFKENTDPFLDTTQSSAVKQACALACQNQDRLAFCCRNYEIQNQNFTCSSPALEINCNLDCTNFACN